MTTKKQLVNIIKQKKELAGITDSVVLNSLNDYLKKYSISPAEIPQPQIKILVKEMRARLRYLVGQFQKTTKNRFKLLQKNEIETLLKSHSSTSERFDFYPQLKKIISDLKVKSILDLGCGINPIALAGKKITYYAADINENDLEIVKQFAEKNNFPIKTFVYDLRKIKKTLPKANLCLILKTLDIVDSKNHALTKKILTNLNCSFLLVSFSTKKLSGKSMNFPKRKWFEKILAELNLPCKKFYSANEVFYLITLKKAASQSKQDMQLSSEQKNA